MVEDVFFLVSATYGQSSLP